MRRIQVALSRLGARVFRNQVGRYELKSGGWLSSGLCVGSSDLVGWLPVAVTPEMVGRRVAVFVAVEVKDLKGRTTPAQDLFLKMVTESGGIAFTARSEAEATDKIGRHYFGKQA